MKRTIQSNVRKVYGPSTQQESQMNAVRKINNLLTSGAVTVTGPNQPKILKQKVASSNLPGSGLQNNQPHLVQQIPALAIKKCYMCDEPTGNQFSILSDAITAHSNTKLPNKIGQIIGEAFMVIISVEDVICKRCCALINNLDRLETDVERVKSNILNFLYRKYGLSDDDRHQTNITTQTSSVPSPPVKMQKLNSGNIINRKFTNDDEQEVGGNASGVMTRKIAVHSVLNRDSVDNQLNVYDSSDKQQPTTTVNQTKITSQATQQQQIRKGPIKIYKCMSCEFKTTDLKQFQPHYETCKQQNGYRCKTCKKVFTNMATLKQHIAEKHSTEFICSICNTNCLNEITLKKHMEMNHPGTTFEQTTTSQLYSCNMCQYKTTDKQNYDDHLRKHIKVKPFKCRLCSVRFETREQASVHAKAHQPNYFKCGTCSASFTQRELLVKHFETHQTSTKVQQPQVMTTQKLLQDTIDEALRESSEGLDSKTIHFFSCNICSLTFIQENYYNQHMETHKRESKKPTVVTTTSSQSLIRQEVRNSNANILTTTTQSASISEADIESIFEKMHSDKTENEASNSNSSENLVITSQENAVGGITFNITIPQQETAEQIKGLTTQERTDQPPTTTASDNISVGIDMPVLDQPDEANQQRSEQQKNQQTAEREEEQQDQSPAPAVSMPSLDDEGDSQSQPSNTDQVPMDLEDMQNSVEGGQIKFILNENGQILQLDNHIITTDADGNQILVQGTDSEQIQQLLQSVGVLQTGDGLDGETLQMIGDNNQMIIVQQGDNEAQLIDASLLNADGHIVIQQAQDGEMSDGTHAIGEDSVRIPVSVAYTTSTTHGQQSETVHQDNNSSNSQQQQQQHDEDENSEHLTQQHSKDQNNDDKERTDNQENTTSAGSGGGGSGGGTPVTISEQTVVTTQSLPTSTGEAFFALEDLMQQPEQKTTE